MHQRFVHSSAPDTYTKAMSCIVDQIGERIYIVYVQEENWGWAVGLESGRACQPCRVLRTRLPARPRGRAGDKS